MKKIILLLSICFSILYIKADNGKGLTLEKIWLEGTFRSNHVYGLKSMNDGIHYMVLEEKDGVQQINKYSYEKGDLASTIFKNDLKDSKGNPLNIESYEISSDESKLLLATNSERIYRHSMRSEYYVYDLSSKSGKRVGKEKFQLAGFSPDGKFLSYVKENNLFIYDVEKNKEDAITNDGKFNHIINGAPDWVYEEEFTLVKAYEWSPDSKYVAYYRFDESAVREFSFPMYTGLYPENYIYKYPKVGEENSKVEIHIYNRQENKNVKVEITGDYEYIPRIKWTNSPGALSLQILNREQNFIRLEFADADAGESMTVFTERSDTYFEVHDIFFLKKSNAFIWLSEAEGRNKAFYYEYHSGEARVGSKYGVANRVSISEDNMEITEFIGFNEEKGIAYYTIADQYNPQERLTMMYFMDEKRVQHMPLLPGVGHIEPSKNYDFFIQYASNAVHPGTVSVQNKDGFMVRMIEENKAAADTIRSYNLSRKEFFKFKNREGTDLYGWMIKPKGFQPNKEYPVLMYVYGGPGSQTVMNQWGGSNDLWFQYLAQQGYLVVSVDNRGTGGRGTEFRTCTYGQLGKLETEDQIDAAKYLATQTFVDKSRIGIWGWSYGGYMSTLCLAKGFDIFKMAIAVAPVTNWRYYDSIYTERYMGLLSGNEASYDDNSPINHVDKIKGKFLLVHGTADDNVHFQNSAELINALVKNNVQFDLAVYPNKNHGIYGGNTRYHLFTKMTNFIKENL